MSEPAVAPAGEAEHRSRFRLPSAYTILFALIVLAAIATWVIPAGTYTLNELGEPVPGTYHEVASKPARILVDSLTAPINGLYGIEDAKGNINYYNSGSLFGAIDIALFILVIGGFLGVTMRTGAIEAGIGSLVQRMQGKERWMIPVLMSVFALGGTTLRNGGGEPRLLRARDHGDDRRGLRRAHGCCDVLLGCGIGVLGSTVNPFATGIASGIAGIPLSDGIVGRLVILIVGLVIGVFFVLRYADRVKKDPSKSVVYDLKAENEARFRADTGAGEVTLSGKQKAVLAVFALAFAVMIYGVVPWEDIGIPFPTWWWWFPEMTASFLLFAIIIGLIGRMGEGELDDELRRRRPRPARGRADHRHRARNHRDHEQRRDHRHRPALDRARARRHGRGRVPDRDVPPVPPPVVRDPFDLRGSRRWRCRSWLRWRASSASDRARRDRLPERLRRDEPVHSDLGGRDGRPRDRPRPVRHVPSLGLAAARAAQRPDRRRASRRAVL